jgi:hypothetical protein
MTTENQSNWTMPTFNEWEQMQKRYETLRRYIRFFEGKGWTRFDSRHGGMYVVALLVSPDGSRIAKFADTLTTDGWPDYAAWACTQNNPHIPKFYTARTLRDGWFLGIMERLTPLPINDYSDLAFNDSLDDDMRALLWDAKLLNDAVSDAWGRTDSLRAKLSILRMGSKTLRAFARALIAQFNGNAADCHCGNIMLRGNTLVVIDPYAHKDVDNSESVAYTPFIRTN